MAESESPPTSQYFNLTYPLPYVAHVEINRPEKLNAFIEPYVIHLFLFTAVPQWTREIRCGSLFHHSSPTSPTPLRSAASSSQAPAPEPSPPASTSPPQPPPVL
ncbi:MAG: hypothetical protein Q9193_004967 [Seirophora villosa]